MSTAWKSFSTASSMANSATTVLPVPTSPISRRCIRSDAVMSADDLTQGPLLVRGELPGQALVESGGELAADREGHSAALALGHHPGANQHELQIEQLVERQPAPAGLGFGGAGGTVDRAERVGKRGKGERVDEPARAARRWKAR